MDHVLLAGFTHDAAEDLRSGLRRILPGESRAHFLFRRWLDGRRSRAEDGGAVLAERGAAREERSIVALEHAYHGDTVGAMSVGAESAFTDPFRELLFPGASRSFRLLLPMPCGEDARDVRDRLRRINCERLLEEKHGEIAAVIVEPLLQGAGGMIVHPGGISAARAPAVHGTRRAADCGRSAYRLRRAAGRCSRANSRT